MTGAQLLGAWCTTLSIVFIWPQVWRVWAARTTAGLSPLATANNIVSSNLWLAYGIAVARPAGWLANVSFTAAITAIAVALIRDRAMSWWMLQSAYGMSFAIIAATLAVSESSVAWAAIILGVASMVPQLMRVWKADDLGGISLPSMAILMVSCLSWAVYGVVADVILYTVPQLLLIPANGYIAVRAARWRLSERMSVAT
jgi:uncharacterized protein with PQ loop repeat